MQEVLLRQIEELMRETFEGGLPGQGTQYLDHASGIRATLAPLSAEAASHSRGDHPSIAAHVRHMAFHLRVSAEWIEGVRIQRDWVGSFMPYSVTPDEWIALQQELEAARRELLRVLRDLPPERFTEVEAGLGVIAHLAYHLGAIRQLSHGARDQVRSER
jgi:hypothetical protein